MNSTSVRTDPTVSISTDPFRSRRVRLLADPGSVDSALVTRVVTADITGLPAVNGVIAHE